MAGDRSRKNVANACTCCRTRKRKCDGLAPTCSMCVKHDRVCLYEDTPSTGPRKTQSHDADRIRDLEDQIAILKDNLKQMEADDLVTHVDENGALEEEQGEEQREEHGEEQGEARAEGQDDRPLRLEIDSPRKCLNNPREADVEARLPMALDELSDLMWTVHIGTEGEASFQGPSGNHSFPQPASSEKLLFHDYARDGDADAMAQQHIHDATLKQHLMSLFLDHVNIFHCFIQGPIDQTTLFQPSNPIPLQFLHASILAAGSLFSTNQRGTSAGHAYLAFAESIAIECCRDHPSTPVIRGMAILSWIRLSLQHDNMGWMYNSMAVSLVVHLGLHCSISIDSMSNRPLEEGGEELGNEVFWSVCLLDRIATSILGRSCALPWRRIWISLQSLSEPTFRNGDKWTFSLQCRLWHLHDQYMDQIYSPQFLHMDGKRQTGLLARARDALLELKNVISSRSPRASKSACLLHISFYTSLTLIHRPFLKTSQPDTIRRLALRTITAAAGSCTKLVRSLIKVPDFHMMPFYLVHHTHTIGISHLLNATSTDTKLRTLSTTRLRDCIHALELLKKTWPSRASHAVQAIQELAHRWRVVYALPLHLSTSLPDVSAQVCEDAQDGHRVDRIVLPEVPEPGEYGLAGLFDWNGFDPQGDLIPATRFM